MGTPPHSYPHSGAYDKHITVRVSSNGLTNHLGRDVYRGLLMHAGLLLLLLLLLLFVVVVAPQGSRLTSSRALGITVTLLRSNGDASMGLDEGAMR